MNSNINFPLTRPEIEILPTDRSSFAVDCPELRWWQIVPKEGEFASHAEYEAVDGSLRCVFESRAGAQPGDRDQASREESLRRALKLGQNDPLEGVEIERKEWAAGRGWLPETERIFAQLTSDQARFLAVYTPGYGWYTYKDPDFDMEWGDVNRRIEPRLPANGPIRLGNSGKALGAGAFDVRIDGRTFECMRVYEDDIGDGSTFLDDLLVEGYLTRNGRVLLSRHYCHESRTNVELNREIALTVNGERFVLWYEAVSSFAFRPV